MVNKARVFIAAFSALDFHVLDNWTISILVLTVACWTVKK